MEKVSLKPRTVIFATLTAICHRLNRLVWQHVHTMPLTAGRDRNCWSE
jgi:hypothetical protein